MSVCVCVCVCVWFLSAVYLRPDLADHQDYMGKFFKVQIAGFQTYWKFNVVMEPGIYILQKLSRWFWWFSSLTTVIVSGTKNVSQTVTVGYVCMQTRRKPCSGRTAVPWLTVRCRSPWGCSQRTGTCHCRAQPDARKSGLSSQVGYRRACSCCDRNRWSLLKIY